MVPPPVGATGNKGHHQFTGANGLAISTDKVKNRPTGIIRPGRTGNHQTIPRLMAEVGNRTNGHLFAKKGPYHCRRQPPITAKGKFVRGIGLESFKAHLNVPTLQPRDEPFELHLGLLGIGIVDDENALSWQDHSCLAFCLNSTPADLPYVTKKKAPDKSGAFF